MAPWNGPNYCGILLHGTIIVNVVDGGVAVNFVSCLDLVDDVTGRYYR